MASAMAEARLIGSTQAERSMKKFGEAFGSPALSLIPNMLGGSFLPYNPKYWFKGDWYNEEMVGKDYIKTKITLKIMGRITAIIFWPILVSWIVLLVSNTNSWITKDEDRKEQIWHVFWIMFGLFWASWVVTGLFYTLSDSF